MLPILPQTQIPFLQEKIADLRSALFFSLSNAVLKIPTTIVTALKVDDVGQVWFFVSRPLQHIQEFDKEFPARLEFFKKGKSFFLKVMGKACIVNDPEELNGLVSFTEDVKGKAMNGLILIKVKIQTIEYVCSTPSEPYGWMNILRTQYNRWFKTQPVYRPYILQPAH